MREPPSIGSPAILILSVLLAWLAPLGTLRADSVEVILRAPLTTHVSCPTALAGGAMTIHAVVRVPQGAPADLGVGAFVSDRHGRWFQEVQPGVLAPGTHTIAIDVDADAPLVNEPDRAEWNADAEARTAKAGLFFWSTSDSRALLTIDALSASPRSGLVSWLDFGSKPRRRALTDLRLDGIDASGTAHGVTGERWTLSVMPMVFPANPYDPREFALDAVFTTPDGAALRVPAFYDQPMRLIDRGDCEDARPDGPGRFAVRFRPRAPGRYRIRLEARWGGKDAASVDIALPDLVVSGVPRDDYLRIDAKDPRFFSVGGVFQWPIGLNINSVSDARSQHRIGTLPTPERGSHAYLPRLARFAAAGGTAVEIWMSSWNLALEWRAERSGYAGIGRYSEANAARLDAILDAAWALGLRVNLVICNHGQASPRWDTEWPDNPWNKVNGGPLDTPYQVFASPLSVDGQARLRRYLIARYADHPGLMAWKLWSEINLTAAGDINGNPDPRVSDAERHATLLSWHEQASASWRAMDIYQHPVTTHWAGDYKRPDRDIVALPGIDFMCIDAYMSRNGGQKQTIVELLANGTQDPEHGWGTVGKPVLVTEYGGTSQGASDAELIAAQATGPWTALVSGYAGSPMMWWFEWVDQGDHWQPYGAISRFLHGEDLRGDHARAARLGATSGVGALWSCAWVRPGRMLGYVVDLDWASNGLARAAHDHAVIAIGTGVPAGDCVVEWWNADRGTLVKSERLVHSGGALALHPPSFTNHLAFKLARAPAQRQ